MNSKGLLINSSERFYLIIALSLAPLAVKLIELLLTGSYLAALVCLAVVLPVFTGFLGNDKWLGRMLRYWAFMLIAYGLLRSLMHLLVLSVGNGVESSIWYQFTWFFHLKNMGFVVLGLYLRYLVKARQKRSQHAMEED